MENNPLNRKKLMHCWLLAVCLAVFWPCAGLGQEKILTNPLKMTFIRLEPGVFMMGSPETDPLRNSSEIYHRVEIKKAFYLQEAEVTINQWETVMGKRWLFKPIGTGDMPMTRVSYYDCQNFIRRLNSLYGGRYRLPTEAEWEYACRAGTATVYSTGNEIGCKQAMFGNNPSKSFPCRDVYQTMNIPGNSPAPVKTFGPNPWGFYDMHGNVWEWCSDFFAPYLNRPETDGFAVIESEARVRRGGSWFGPSYHLRSANRAHAHPGTRLQTTGFRLVLEAD